MERTIKKWGDVKKNIKNHSVSKVGVAIYISAFLIEMTLGYLLKIEPPIVLRYIFYGGLILSLIGIVIQGSKNKKTE